MAGDDRDGWGDEVQDRRYLGEAGPLEGLALGLDCSEAIDVSLVDG